MYPCAVSVDSVIMFGIPGMRLPSSFHETQV